MALDPREARRRNGVYYTPVRLVDYVVRHTLGPLLHGRTAEDVAELRILDPACGDGAFLVGAFRFLLAWYRDQFGRLLTVAERWDILRRHIHGIDIDESAVTVARRRLSACCHEPRPLGSGQSGRSLTVAARRGLKESVRVGNALLVSDWDGPFHLVFGNPPWGQKAIVADANLKRYLWQRYPSSAGIFDLFRPFVELGVRLTADGGRFGMVLPDVVLLKNYPQTRLLLLDQLELKRIDWWGQAFAGATIDTVTVIGSKRSAGLRHRVAVTVHDDPPLQHAIAQADFRANPRHVFNLYLTPQRRRFLRGLANCPRLGAYFEFHEGVHSGNLRSELFVAQRQDDSCRELLFGRDEIAPYRLQWRGRYVRLAALPTQRTRQRYANLGRKEWHERDKVLVRRTGDHVLAAVDRAHRYVSNNFFLVFAKQPCALDLDGLCALLNSRFMTTYFRLIEPRRGRVFAELKIKHLSAFPLPHQVLEKHGCRRLNDLGRRSAHQDGLAAEVDRLVNELMGVTAEQATALGL
jgi:hypothetical protein